jgi:hypothetical protein
MTGRHSRMFHPYLEPFQYIAPEVSRFTRMAQAPCRWKIQGGSRRTWPHCPRGANNCQYHICWPDEHEASAFTHWHHGGATRYSDPAGVPRVQMLMIFRCKTQHSAFQSRRRVCQGWIGTFTQSTTNAVKSDVQHAIWRPPSWVPLAVLTQLRAYRATIPRAMRSTFSR